MKYVVNLKPKEQLNLNDIEKKVKSARNSNDCILVNFGRDGKFIKIAFSKDQTYTIGHNIWNMEYSVKTNVLTRQYRVSVSNVLANYLTNWVNKLNK